MERSERGSESENHPALPLGAESGHNTQRSSNARTETEPGLTRHKNSPHSFLSLICTQIITLGYPLLNKVGTSSTPILPLSFFFITSFFTCDDGSEALARATQGGSRTIPSKKLHFRQAQPAEKKAFPKNHSASQETKTNNNNPSSNLKLIIPHSPLQKRLLPLLPNTTPDLRKSPLFEFASPAKSPHRSSNAIFLHIPARTASLLLEAALRIQKHSKTKPHHKTTPLGYSGRSSRGLTQRGRNRRNEIEGGNNSKVSVKDILRWDSSVGRKSTKRPSNGSRNVVEENKGVVAEEVGFTCSCNGRPSSAVWSESNEDKSLDMETSSSGHSYDSVEETELWTNRKKTLNALASMITASSVKALFVLFSKKAPPPPPAA
ncbi:hypothetical protein SESBI_15068 [Sesbania bispinosa]|nr:hypothetical protein SESBI_15068 [Sesbania bispinosa]